MTHVLTLISFNSRKLFMLFLYSKGPIQLAKMCLESAQLRRFILPVRYPLPFHLHHTNTFTQAWAGVTETSLPRGSSSHYVMPPVCLTWRWLWTVCWDGWVHGVRDTGRSGCLGQEIWTRGSISLTLTCDIDRPCPWTCDGPFCHGQITWENGPSPSRKVQSEGPSLLVHPSGEGAGVGGVHRISGTGGPGSPIGLRRACSWYPHVAMVTMNILNIHSQLERYH